MEPFGWTCLEVELQDLGGTCAWPLRRVTDNDSCDRDVALHAGAQLGMIALLIEWMLQAHFLRTRKNYSFSCLLECATHDGFLALLSYETPLSYRGRVAGYRMLEAFLAMHPLDRKGSYRDVHDLAARTAFLAACDELLREELSTSSQAAATRKQIDSMLHDTLELAPQLGVGQRADVIQESIGILKQMNLEDAQEALSLIALLHAADDEAGRDASSSAPRRKRI